MQNNTESKKRIVIVGGGFAGIRAALELSRRVGERAEITLIASRPHFEYNPALYRYVTGNSSIEVCIPLDLIFKGKKVTVVRDYVTSLDKAGKKVSCESGKEYAYDKLILALGSETTYMGIPGLKEHSYGMKTVTEALRLKEQVIATLYLVKEHNETSDKIRDANFVVIGGGATGVEMAGRLIEYARALAEEMKLDPTLVSVSLIEGASKVLFRLPKDFTDPIEEHLRRSGVTLLMNRRVMKQEVEDIYLKDMQMKTSTVIWTAGVRANILYEASGFTVNPQGKVDVDEHLYARRGEGIFVVGDGAQTKYSGWAQTAFYDGKYVAKVIESEMNGKSLPVYDAPNPVNAIPAGDGWAGVLIDLWGVNITFYGRIGWWFRRLADLRSFMVILPFRHAYKVWTGGCLSDTCDVCGVETTHLHP
jgi:NADH dehydrogenase